MLLRVLVLLPAVALLISHTGAEKKVFCYYSSFAQTRQGVGKFLPEDIDPYLCTHIIYAFVDIYPDGTDLMSFNRNDVGPTGLYERTIALKQKNPALKVLLAVGGWQIGSKPFIPMMQDEGNMRQWIKNVVRYLRQYNFDGFDMDWEFPATRGSPPEDKYRYTKLMKGLYEEFAREALETGREKLLLTMATAAGTYFINVSYEPESIIPYMDYMLLMTYNYHGQWEKRTGHHSGLWRHRNDPPGEQSELHQEWSIDYWLDMGMPKDKLVVGLATYGMSFTLVDPWQNGVHAPVNGGGRMGKYTKETGILSYYEICENIQQNGWKTGWIDDQGVPYAYGGDQWVGFDNIESIQMKAENIVKRDLAGAFVWSVEMDDFNGVCGDGRYPLLSTITRVLKPYEGVARHAHAETKQPQQFVMQTPHLQAEYQWHLRVGAQVETATPGSIFTRQPTSNSNTRVSWWGRPIWRAQSTQVTRSPWWVRSLSSTQRPTVHWNARPTGRPIRNEVSWTTSDPWLNLVNEKTTNDNAWQIAMEEKDKDDDSSWSNAVEEKSKDDDSSWNNAVEEKDKDDDNSWSNAVEEKEKDDDSSWRNAVEEKDKSDDKSWRNTVEEKVKDNENPWKPKSSAGAQNGGTSVIHCRTLGSGLFRHPEDCEKFVMCLSGAWMDYPPHIMSCPAGTRFDDNLKVCNHAKEVEC